MMKQIYALFWPRCLVNHSFRGSMHELGTRAVTRQGRTRKRPRVQPETSGLPAILHPGSEKRGVRDRDDRDDNGRDRVAMGGKAGRRRGCDPGVWRSRRGGGASQMRAARVWQGGGLRQRGCVQPGVVRETNKP